MNIKITPSPLSGILTAPPSKSVAHRILIAAALSENKSEIFLPFISNDLMATLSCLSSLGAEIEIKEKKVFISPICASSSPTTLNCSESGSTLRFLLPVAAALQTDAFFEGEGRLPSRPLTELMEALSAHGVSFSKTSLPFRSFGALQAGSYTLPGNISSQYISGLLFALPLLTGDSEIFLSSPLESAAYVDMTITILKDFGVCIQKTPSGYFIKGKQSYSSKGKLSVEGDYSNAAFFLSAGAINGKIAVKGLFSESIQGDKKILSLLQGFGGNIETIDHIAITLGKKLFGTQIDVCEIPDLFPILSVVAAAAHGETALINASRLRLKESDRLVSTKNMLTALGAELKELPDGLLIIGNGRLKGGIVNSENDHRIAMSAAIASVICESPVVIQNAEAVLKSYPNFFDEFQSLGGKIDVL